MTSCHFSAPGRIAAALPALFGFVPVRSLAIVAFKANQIVVALRADLDGDLIGCVEEIAQAAARAGAETATAIVVDDEGALCPLCTSDHRRLCEALAAALAAEQVEMRGAHVVDAVAAGGRWRCLDGCGACGEVDDPTASPLAVSAVLAGRRLYARREDLEAVVRPTDTDRTAALAEVIASCANGVPADSAAAAARAAAALLDANGDLADRRIAGLVLALADGAVRDALYALAVEPAAGSLENLWAFLARTTPDPWRAESLAMQAFFAFARGDGTMAGIALDAALHAAPDHRMAGMLYDALYSGVQPTHIRELACAAQARNRL